MLQKIRNLSLNNRIALFIGILIFYFVIIIPLTNSNDAYQESKNTQAIWMVSGLLIAGLWAVFFPNKKKHK